MAKKDIIGTYSDSFNATSKGQSFAKRMNDLEVALKNAKKPYIIGYKRAMAKVDSDRKLFGWGLGKVNAKYAEINAQKNFEIKNDVQINKILADIENLKAEKQNAIKVYAEKIESNEAWNGICHRKRSIKILNAIASGDYTESELENLVYDKSEVKAHENGQRLGFPIKYLVKLGWIGRDNVGDNATHFITDEGKRQIDFYERFGMFDSSMVA